MQNMSEDSDQEISELDIEARTWNKLQTAMKLFGFREGAVEGKNLSLQEGFNLGYMDGFKLGEYLGMCKGIITCEEELQLPPDKKSGFEEETLNKLQSQHCVLCEEEKNCKTSSSTKIPFENTEKLISTQQGHSNEIIKTLKNSNLVPYFDKG